MATANTRKNKDRAENDLYQTSEEAVELAISAGVFEGVSSVYDPCDGKQGITRVLEKYGIDTVRSDLIDYGTGAIIIDFLDPKFHLCRFDVDAMTMNPPYTLTGEFLDKAHDGYDKIIMFNRVSFLETAKRARKFASGEWALTDTYFHADRVGCYREEEGDTPKAVFYAWYVFDKELRKTIEHPRMRWIFRDEE